MAISGKGKLELTRRRLLGLGAVAAVPALMGARPTPRIVAAAAPSTSDHSASDLEEISISELAAMIAAGKLSAVEVTRYYLDRISGLSQGGPELRAVIEVNPTALADAAQLDAEFKQGKSRGILHGVPLLVKDDICTLPPTHTTNGIRALLGVRPASDATVVAKLKAAGMVLLGKGNLTSWISGSSGYSSLGGQTRNPYRLDRSPNGSSSGIAVASSANLCAGGIGTETVGSIVGPSGANGVVGIKPTVGLTSRSGMIPSAPTFDTIGPICRTTADAALLLGVLTGVDTADAATAASVGHSYTDYTQFLDPNGLRGARIGIARESFFGYSTYADAIAEAAIKVLENAGATIVDNANIPTSDELIAGPDYAYVAQFTQFKHFTEQFLAATPGSHPRSIDQLIAYNQAHASTELTYFGQDELEFIDTYSGDITSAAYKQALAQLLQAARQDGIDAALTSNNVQALMMPTGGPSWKIDLVNGDPTIMGSAIVEGYAGYPAINVPAGFAVVQGDGNSPADGLPVGLTFMGTAWSEPTLIRFAYAFERASQVRRSPTYRPADVGL